MKASVRPAKRTDIGAVVSMIREFHEDSVNNFGLNYDEENTRMSLSEYVNTSFILEVDGNVAGVIGGLITGYPASGDRVYQEFLWYVKKANRNLGILLFKHLEKWCRKEGIAKIVMAHLGDHIGTKLERFYKRNGYKHLECHYIKNL